MKNLVIYDSQFGNTEKIAQAIAESISASAVKVSNINNSSLDGLDILVVGSPTQGGRATAALNSFLEQIPAGKLEGVKVAAFDTRLDEKDVNFALKLLIKTIGYAAPKIVKILVSKGGKEIIPSEGFIVKGKSGPLADGEIERSKEWIKV